jgi:signal transduction histidine kinase
MKSLASGVAAMLIFAGAAAAADGANKDEAIAMVKKAVGFIKGQGAEKAYAEFTGKAANFIDRDLYVVVYQLDGKVLAHGSNAKFVGKDLIDAQDVDGKHYVKERVEMAAKQPSFWQDYKFVNPVTKKVEPKQMYCEKVDNTAVCAGIYKL